MNPDPETRPVRSARDIAAGTAAGAADLFAGKDLGVFVSGLVLLVEPPNHRKGKSPKGNDYDFYQLKVQIWTGNKAVPCSFRADTLEQLPALQVGSKQSFRVERGSIYEGQMNFDLVAPAPAQAASEPAEAA